MIDNQSEKKKLVEEVKILKKRLNLQKNIEVKFESIAGANHFYNKKEKELTFVVQNYLKEKITIS